MSGGAIPGGDGRVAGCGDIPVLDPALVGQLRSLPGGLAAELWGMFARDYPERIAGILAAAERGDAAAGGRLLHAFKGSVGTLGFARLHAVAAVAEALARRGDPAWAAACAPLRTTAEEAIRAVAAP